MPPVLWLILALFGAFLFAVVHILDAYCVEDIFDKPWMGVITSAITTLVIILAPLPFILPFLHWSLPPQHIIFFTVIAGAAFMLSYLLYFHALSYSEAGIIAAYWNMIPAMILLLSFILFREVLALPEYIGIFVLVGASTFLFLLDTTLEMRVRSFWLMVIACLLQAIGYLLLDASYGAMPYLQVFVLMSGGMVLVGLCPLLFTRVRKEIEWNLPKLLPRTRFFLTIEGINLAALAATQKALDIGTPSLTSALETTIPAFVFLLSLAALAMGLKFGDARSKIHIYWKLTAVGVMTIGVVLVS